MPHRAPVPIVSVKPLTLPAPGRGDPLHVRVTAPVGGDRLPVVVLSHGHGSSLDGYGPLADFWAAHGFVVVQPTHLDSRTLALPADDPRRPRIWRHRVDDLTRVLDHLDDLTGAVPGLAGRVDPELIAVAGHSFGGQTAGSLLGLRVLDGDGDGEDLSDARVRTGVLLATAGLGGSALTPFAAENFPYINPDFTHMTPPVLVVVGDRDDSPLTVRGPDWMTDAYRLSPGDKSLLTLFGAEHSLGGIAGYEARETTDEHPARVDLVRRAALAHLRRGLGLPDDGWDAVRSRLAAERDPLGRIDGR
ncbi:MULTISPECIES: chlorophyllase [unclassified Streptomyces]|uniref:alpha/beta hydrolase family protein n=1 Tax=unclassified Streptomyces TaxID=2593676 RepID=UPI00332B0F97